MIDLSAPAVDCRTMDDGVRRAAPHKWTAFWISLVVPGTGQLLAGSWTCLPCFLAAGGIIAAAVQIEPLVGMMGMAALRTVALVLLSVVSAEHAKRLLEPGSSANPVPWPPTTGNRSSVSGAASRGRRIDVRIDVTVNRSLAETWRRISDLPRFLTIDPFHDRAIVLRKRAAASVDLALHHNAFGRCFWRFGRILRWSEGHGYAFSDLSRYNSHSGFPHVFFVNLKSVEPTTAAQPATSRITIHVRGKWTSRWLPALAGRWWVYGVCREHARLLRKAM